MKKKIGALFLLTGLYVLTSCSHYTNKTIVFKDTDTFKTLNHVDYPGIDYEHRSIPVEKRAAFNDFAYKTSSLLMDNSRNYIYAPLSLYYCLSMIGEGIGDETLNASLDDVLGMTDRRTVLHDLYLNDYYASKNAVLKMANSLWIMDQYPLRETFKETLAVNYFCEAYQTNFDATGRENMAKWINYYSEEMLKVQPSAILIDDNVKMMLINTLYFNHKWKTDFKKSQSFKGPFYLDEHINVQADYMKHVVKSTLYLETTNYQKVEDLFKNGASITYILPKENIALADVVSDQTAMDDVWMESNQPILCASNRREVTLTVPKFKYQSRYDFEPVLEALGLGGLFADGSLGYADENPDSLLSLSRIFQNVGIELKEEGVKAAAFTTGVGATAPAPDEPITITLDRPFMYIIRDTNRIPLFVGTLLDPTK